MSDTWPSNTPGLLRLPSGRLVRGRGLRRPLAAEPGTDGVPVLPEWGVYLLGGTPPEVPWASRWLRWPDFRLPSSRAQAREVFEEAWDRAARERVEFACGGGRGRTGTALACLAVLDGVPADEAVEYVRRHYDRRAVETPWQRRYVRDFTATA
ncbi:protein-tyrosine phosphatase family protein [Streptomyces sp. SP18CS02]|uniref:protein-tyrosine phosphatase family protein n=1 Tax=Streptomyces sp. SP18CS02 TaxID=3002531 RepID=UPI002E76E096|nr:protein phosphatase [Streptomyces sp. SP18CS02]MEE1752069.1 protein phosphatase [Streptomyces sp. SP18CS02]